MSEDLLSEMMDGATAESGTPVPSVEPVQEVKAPYKPTGRPKGVPNKSKEDKRFDLLENRINGLVNIVGELADKLLTPTNEVSVPVVPLTPAPSAQPEPVKHLVDLSMPTPPSWIAKMTDILGEGFEMEVVEGGVGDALMKVYLPEHLKRDRTIKGRDHSSGLIRRASALQDVENWCMKIKANIQKTHPTFKSIINVS